MYDISAMYVYRKPKQYTEMLQLFLDGMNQNLCFVFKVTSITITIGNIQYLISGLKTSLLFDINTLNQTKMVKLLSKYTMSCRGEFPQVKGCRGGISRSIFYKQIPVKVY